MRIPAILQGEARTRFFQGIAFGAVAAVTIGFIWGGWVKAAGPYSRDNVIGEFVRTVASTSMDYSFAKACAAGVEAELLKSAAKS